MSMLCQHSADRLRINNISCSISREHGNKVISDNILSYLIHKVMVVYNIIIAKNLHFFL